MSKIPSLVLLSLDHEVFQAQTLQGPSRQCSKLDKCTIEQDRHLCFSDCALHLEIIPDPSQWVGVMVNELPGVRSSGQDLAPGPQ